MEETLRLLREAMAAHRLAMRGAGRPKAKAGPAVVPDDARDGVVRMLSHDIERVCGIEISGIMEAKLGRVLGSVALPALEGWVARLQHLPDDDPEWLSLIESLTVHETFFHRDQSQLDLLRRQLLPEAIAAAARDGRYRLRLWSAGCATGEEAYTLAILSLLALRDAGWARETADAGLVCEAPWQVDVLGSDISRVVLRRAEAAVYPAQELGAFRQLPIELDRFFRALPAHPDAPGVALRGVHAGVRRHVRFGPCNLVAETPPERDFDIVLCRNVLIYLTVAARAKALSVLRQALRPGGFLMLGPTDALTDRESYATRWADGAIAYQLRRNDG
ncbi:MAG TPA: CheR family methyltransferase [Stellaceae bacterium]|nr:CheR family methyltransferase [Stellaceae bacterium]